jgi:tRNA(Ile2) C34 agmatinyltransferase TiaS
MIKTEKQRCIDCLHCKVSVKSTANNRLYYCAESGKRKRHREPYWLAKKICQGFYDMGGLA